MKELEIKKESFSVTNAGKVELPSKYLTPKVSNEDRNKAIEFIKEKNSEIFITGKSRGGLCSPNEVKKKKAKDINEMLIYLLRKANKGKYRKSKFE